MANGEAIGLIETKGIVAAVEACDAALKAAERGGPVRLLLIAGNVYRTAAIDYHGGPRYPHLERIPGAPDVLSTIAHTISG